MNNEIQLKTKDASCLQLAHIYNTRIGMSSLRDMTVLVLEAVIENVGPVVTLNL